MIGTGEREGAGRRGVAGGREGSTERGVAGEFGEAAARVLPLSHLAVFLLIHLGTGLFTPVLSLMLLARGATLETLPIAVGATIVVTCACEVPSGIAADVMGRRAVFVLAMAFQIAAHIALLAGTGLAAVLASSVLRGLALAARTGTLEAIELDCVVAAHPDAAGRLAALDALNGRLALLESVGVGAGALLGGALAAVDQTYTLLISCVIVACAAALAGALALFPPDAPRPGSARSRLLAAVGEIRTMIARPGDVRTVLMASASAGAVMVVVETYWQLAFEGIVGAGGEWMLGFVNCAGMAGAALGSAAAMRWGSAASESLGPRGRRTLYALMQLVAIGCLALFALARVAPVFVAVYVALYIVLGARSVIEQTVLHNAVPSRERSGMSSVQSIALRGGGMVATAVAGPVVAALSLVGAWPVFAGLAAVMAAAGFALKAGPQLR